jgi:hypothetical protein
VMDVRGFSFARTAGFPQCPHGNHDWHGLPNAICSGSICPGALCSGSTDNKVVSGAAAVAVPPQT